LPQLFGSFSRSAHPFGHTTSLPGHAPPLLDAPPLELVEVPPVDPLEDPETVTVDPLEELAEGDPLDELLVAPAPSPPPPLDDAVHAEARRRVRAANDRVREMSMDRAFM